VESYDIDMEQQKVTVKTSLAPDVVLQTVAKTGKTTAFWEEEAPAEAAEPEATEEEAPAKAEPEATEEEAPAKAKPEATEAVTTAP
ncbi:hypothetical protein MKW94_015075, partial [Papaver nudicaule]|nr:hypothetical protein [Papaver nudicaule]